MQFPHRKKNDAVISAYKPY